MENKKTRVRRKRSTMHDLRTALQIRSLTDGTDLAQGEPPRLTPVRIEEWNRLPLAERKRIRDATQDRGAYVRALEALLKTTRARAQSKAREHKLTMQDLMEIFDRQRGRCALTGVRMVIGRTAREAESMSLDRMDSAKGYTPDNVQIVCLWANQAKSMWNAEVFYRMCAAAVGHGKAA